MPLTPPDDLAVTAAESRRTDDRQRLELALSAARMGSFDWDLIADKVVISEQAARIFGAEPGEHDGHEGKLVFSILPREDREAIIEMVMSRIRAGENYELEHRAINQRDGREFWAFSAGTPLRGVGGRVERVLGVCQDISERKAAEAQRETPGRRARPPGEERAGLGAVAGPAVGAQGRLAGRLPEDLRRSSQGDGQRPHPADRHPLAGRPT